MNHEEIIDRLEQNTVGAHINKLIWIAASLESSQLKEFVDDLSFRDWRKLFPDEIKNSEIFADYYEDEEMVDWLTSHNKWGFLVEAYFPHCDSFGFDEDGKPRSWRVHGGHCRIEYFYSDDLEEIISMIETKSKDIFLDNLAEFKEKQGENS